MASPKALHLSEVNVPLAEAPAGNALSHLQPPVDRTARGIKERTEPDRSTSRLTVGGPAARYWSRSKPAMQSPQL